jgi:ketosteroid isomerase-like protein
MRRRIDGARPPEDRERMDQDAVGHALRRYFDLSAAGEEEAAHAMYAPDAVLEFPQSGERFEGVANFLVWRRDYPAAEIDVDLHRVRGAGDVWVAELTISYDGGAPMYGVDVLEFRGDQVCRETIYVTEGFPAPESRAAWRAAPPAD